MIDEKTAPYGVLVLRLGLGALFLAHGLLKVLVFTIPGTVGYFASLGLPSIAAYATIAAELGGGALLILGLYTRVVSLALIPVLIGALAFAHADKGWVFSSEGGGWEFIAFWIAAQVTLALTGPGALALDAKVPAARLKTA